MKIKLFAVVVVLLTTLASCTERATKQEASNVPIGNHRVLVEEVLQASDYTYLKVKERSMDYWIAVIKDEYKEGETYYYVEGLEMSNFESKDLGKTFESILLVSIISDQPIDQGTPAETEENLAEYHPETKNVASDNIKVEPAEGGVTIEQLFSDKKNYSGKTVKIKGVVVKYNPEIMGKNWAHIQDGTKSGNDFDLTVTTSEQFNVGDTITIEGKITLEKDFGSGYFYDLIMEEATKIN